MKSVPLIVLSFLLIVCADAASMQGDVTFTLTKPGSPPTLARTFGDNLKATCDWRVVKVLGEEKLFAGISVKNTESKPLWFVYSVAFFDKDGKTMWQAP